MTPKPRTGPQPQTNFHAVEKFNRDSGAFEWAGTAKLCQRDQLLVEIARYLDQRAGAKTKLKLSTEKESELLAQIRARLEGGGE